MNGIDALIEKIDAKANRACEEKLAEAESAGGDRARRIPEPGRGCRAATGTCKRRGGGGNTARRGRRLFGAFQKLLAAKHMMLNAAFERARNRLVNLSKETKSSPFSSKSRRRRLRGRRAVLLTAMTAPSSARRRSRALTRRWPRPEKRLRFVWRKNAVRWTAVLSSKAATSRRDCSMASVIAQTRTELSDEVVKVLFS